MKFGQHLSCLLPITPRPLWDPKHSVVLYLQYKVVPKSVSTDLAVVGKRIRTLTCTNKCMCLLASSNPKRNFKFTNAHGGEVDYAAVSPLESILATESKLIPTSSSVDGFVDGLITSFFPDGNQLAV